MAALARRSPVVYRSAPAPKVQIVRVSPAPMTRTRRRGGGGGRSRARAGGGNRGMGMAMAGGFVLGALEKADLGLPTIPVLGKSGTIALAAWAIGKYGNVPILRDLAVGMAAVTAYQLGSKGTIDGY